MSCRARVKLLTDRFGPLSVSIAESGTATHVEKLARQQRQVCEAEQRAQAVAQQERRSLTYFWDSDGCLVMQGRLPPEQGASLVKALAAADAALGEDASAEASEAEVRSWRVRQADALTVVAESAFGWPPFAPRLPPSVHVRWWRALADAKPWLAGGRSSRLVARLIRVS